MPHASTAGQLDVLAGLNPQQRAAAELTAGPVCILAGAGTGKTRTITHRIAHQVATGAAQPQQVLAATFTDKAARELRHRLQTLGIPEPVRAATFHAAAWAQLRFFWPRLHDGPLPQVLDSKLRLLVPAARRLRVEAKDLAAEIEWAKARRLGPEDYAAALGARRGPLEPEHMAALYADYEADKAARNLLDYEDMILVTTGMLDTRADIAEQVRDRYRFFTVDEFQDVNPAQYALLRAWMGQSDELCVVGDDDQSIYGFTGATPDYLIGFGRAFPHARVVSLTRSYRSTAQVLDLANRVLWTKPPAQRKRLVTQLAGGPAPVFREFADADAEVAAVVTRIRQLLAAGVPAGAIAVCYRINSQSEAFEQALRDAAVPFVVRGEGGFFQRPEIRQALRALRAAVGRWPGTDQLGPAGAVPAAPPRADREVERVLREQLSWHPRREPAGEAARERWRNLGALLEVAGRIAQDDPQLDFAGLVTALRQRAEAGPDSPTDGGGVELLTLHRAKGLEFDAVFVVACEEGLLPISHAQIDAAIEEERRLLYVGVTRARRHLWLSWSLSRPGRHGTPVSRRPSRLLYNLGPGAPQSGGGRPAASSGSDPALAQRLRAWRAERARRDAVPAFVVFSDKTLSDLAARRPSTPQELLAVHGLGQTKVERYGDELLQALRGAV